MLHNFYKSAQELVENAAQPDFTHSIRVCVCVCVCVCTRENLCMDAFCAGILVSLCYSVCVCACVHVRAL